jgi:GTPase SAR1 family protein
LLLKFLLGPTSLLAQQAITNEAEAIAKLCEALNSHGKSDISQKLQKRDQRRKSSSTRKLHCVVKSTLKEKYDDVKFGMMSVYIQAMTVRSRKELSVEEMFVGDVMEVPDEDGVTTMHLGERCVVGVNMPFGSVQIFDEKKDALVSQIAVLVNVKEEELMVFQIPTVKGCFFGMFLPGTASLDLMQLAVKPGGLDCFAWICNVPVVEVFISQVPPVNVSFSYHALREVAPGVILMGEAGVGKSSIIKQLVADSEYYLKQSTALKWSLPDDILICKHGGSETGYTALHICEVPGMDAIRRSLTSNIFNHLRMSAGVVFVFSVNNAESLFAAHDCLEEARLYAPSEAQFFLMGNKVDMASHIPEGKVALFASQSGIADEHMFMVSCLNEQGIRDAFSTIAASAHTVQLQFDSGIRDDNGVGSALEKCKVS